MSNIDPSSPIVQTAVFGEQVQQFLDSDIGQYLIARAEEEYEEAIQKLLNTSPWRRRRVQELQNQASNAANFQKWLAKSVENGYAALQIIEEGE